MFFKREKRKCCIKEKKSIMVYTRNNNRKQLKLKSVTTEISNSVEDVIEHSITHSEQ